ncbi:hypothetical protein Taro_038030 [Colocasia esculenta]|uniref:Uncharacterized protein n=1 Tax=Colocasia esculenta TaxID=4460 RepID=A0A843WRG4_COLES|nr:hypothetical protein [Colocasia esculenta]
MARTATKEADTFQANKYQRYFCNLSLEQDISAICPLIRAAPESRPPPPASTLVMEGRIGIGIGIDQARSDPGSDRIARSHGSKGSLADPGSASL